ncbi:MAG: YicC family protein [Betaproteobacteria bacterium]|nr:YicC family protein [Betaproteobacteria bacterium]
MIFSMTGYAAVTRDLPVGSLTLELRSVNHRYLDITFRAAEEFRVFEPAMREMLAAKHSRGKLECRISLNRGTAAPSLLEINVPLLDKLVELNAQVQSKLPQATTLSVSDILRWPGMFGAETLPMEELRETTLGLLAEALAEFTASRGREGEKLKQLLIERADRMDQLAKDVAPKIPQLVAAQQERFVQRMREAGVTMDEERIRQEVVMYASRIDVDEELSRLHTHLGELRRILGKGGAVGKRLDFLMQELNREANTLGSKSVDVDVSQTSMELKVLIEQMREQVQNIE